ncbi:hypothetical protein WN943_005621 [Citrus x changshan-huyou]|uniref:pentatricopeptide repeat-containing protein At3g29290 n=1 Tax=Citrus sinensis TaxID=2711 RepID=UPI0003D76E8C|nr:pentatricopeptide repeat-containing protein At3g29290 [Citrus sinensis]
MMGEVLSNSVSVIIASSGFACCQNNLYGRPSTSSYTICCRKYGCVMLHGSTVKSKRCISFGCLRMKGPQRLHNSIIASNIVASIEPVTTSEDVRENHLIERREEFLDLDFVGSNLPPWGNVVVQQGGSDVEVKSGNQPLAVSGKMAFGSEIRVQFLEEANEEILSRRVLMLSRSNKVRSALELYESMKCSGLQPNVHACNSLLSCLIRNGLLDYALRVFEFMRTNEITMGHSYSLILKAVEHAQGFDSALDMFVGFGGYSRQKKDFDVIVYNTMISVCGRVNNWIETEKLWRSMKEDGLIGTRVTYSLLVCIFARCSQNELALDAYNEMIQNGLEPGDDVTQAVIGSCTREGKWDLALNLFENMLNGRLKPNLISCNALINSLGKAGEVKLAFKVHGIIKILGHTPDVYTWNGLLTALYKANQHADALQLFESIKTEQSSELNVHLYNTALMACQKLGLWEKSLQLLWQMETSELPVSTSSYNIVIHACEIARKPKIALQVYEHMVHRKCTPDTLTYLSLIRGCIWGSLWAEVEEILEVAPDVSLYNAVIQGMCLRGKFESAKKLYTRMREIGLKPDGKTRALMLQNLQRKI